MTDPQTTQPVVEVYWRPGCPYCWMLLRPLRRSGLQLREITTSGKTPKPRRACGRSPTETKPFRRCLSATAPWSIPPRAKCWPPPAVATMPEPVDALMPVTN
jgi:hypothetical protein